MGCKGIHCDGCKSPGGIGAIAALIIALVIIGGLGKIAHDMGHLIHELVIGLFIFAGIAGASFGIPIAIILAINRRQSLTTHLPLPDDSRVINTYDVHVVDPSEVIPPEILAAPKSIKQSAAIGRPVVRNRVNRHG